MLVADWMSPSPTTVSPDTPVIEALRLLRDRDFRRLPVVQTRNGTSKLVGIVTDKDLKDAAPSAATTLSLWELNDLLAKLAVREVMARPVITAHVNEALEDAALRMQDHKVAGLPVLDDKDNLVGILTISDVLRALITVLGLNEGGIRLSLEIPDTPGALAHVLEAILPSNVISMATVGIRDGQRQLVIRVGGEHADSVIDRLSKHSVKAQIYHSPSGV